MSKTQRHNTVHSCRKGFSTGGTDIHEMRDMWHEQRALTKKLLQSDQLSTGIAPPNKVQDTKCVDAGELAPSPWSTSDPPGSANSMSTKPEPSIRGKCDRYINEDNRDKPSPPGTPEESCTLDQIGDKGGSEVASPPMEDEAPSTPSTTESNLIRVGLTDDDSEAAPMSSDAADPSGSGSGLLPTSSISALPRPPPPPPPGKLRNSRVPPAPSLQKVGELPQSGWE